MPYFSEPGNAKSASLHTIEPLRPLQSTRQTSYDLESYCHAVSSTNRRLHRWSHDLGAVDRTWPQNSLEFIVQQNAECRPMRNGGHPERCECISCSFEKELHRIGYYERQLARRENYKHFMARKEYVQKQWNVVMVERSQSEMSFLRPAKSPKKSLRSVKSSPGCFKPLYPLKSAPPCGKKLSISPYPILPGVGDSPTSGGPEDRESVLEC